MSEVEVEYVVRHPGEDRPGRDNSRQAPGQTQAGHAAASYPEHDRVAIFTAYNPIWAQLHRLNLSHGLIESMPTKRRSLFRGVYAHDFSARPHETGDNRQYSEASRTL